MPVKDKAQMTVWIPNDLEKQLRLYVMDNYEPNHRRGAISEIFTEALQKWFYIKNIQNLKVSPFSETENKQEEEVKTSKGGENTNHSRGNENEHERESKTE